MKFFIICGLLSIVLVKTGNGQMKKKIPVEFTRYGKKEQQVNYYFIKQDTAVKLVNEAGKLLIPREQMQQKAFNIIAVFLNKAITFRIESDELYSISIIVRRKGMFGSEYSVNLGSDYDELVKPVDEKLRFKNLTRLE